ncbi:MAG: hypothetical protein QG597_1069, partial [Actinomycetota bacterium]|nr:hypothetical protein [Actinomycetota bacterium]
SLSFQDEVIAALEACASPTLFTESVEAIFRYDPIPSRLGRGLGKLCRSKAELKVGGTAKDWLLAADALETLTQLALGGTVRPHGLMELLTEIAGPVPLHYGRSVVRCVAALFEQRRDEELLDVLRRIGGLIPPLPDTEQDLWPDEVLRGELLENDIAYELGCASLLKALGAHKVADARSYLDESLSQLLIAAESDDGRVDALVMSDVVRLLLTHLPDEHGYETYAATELRELAERLRHNAREHVLESAGLKHWRTSRLDAEVAWVHLAHEVAQVKEDLLKPTWYQATLVISGVLDAYSATRCSLVMQSADSDGVRALIGPAIESGIAVQANHMYLLEEHINALEAAVTAGETAREAELEASRELLVAARRSMVSGAPRPKAAGASPSSDGRALPHLRRLLNTAEDLVSTMEPSTAALIDSCLAAKLEAADSALSGTKRLVLSKVQRDLVKELSKCDEYRGDVKDGVDLVLIYLLRFWVSREGKRKSKASYLFRADVLEEALADDLNNFFDSSELLGNYATEVRDIGGGRVDVMVPFDGFRLYIELKRDFSTFDISDMRGYLQQTGTYQYADVRIGFLVVLDLRKRTGMAPHLTECFQVVVLDDGKPMPRYVITMLVPGNKKEPSAAKNKARRT